MRNNDFYIRERTAEEVRKLGNNEYLIADKIHCPPNQIKHWLDCEFSPSAHSLKILHYAGCDVLYILTGQRYTITGGDPDVRY